MTTIEQIPSTIVDPAGAGIRSRYENFIGGDWVAPTTGEYRDNVTPATGEAFTQVAYSSAADIELALDAAHAAKDAWGEASTTERARVLNRVAEAIEENLETLAIRELRQRQADPRDARRRHSAGR
jgi:aldehyde dehydrogenase